MSDLLLLAEEPVDFLKPLTDVEVLEGQTATLQCEVSKPNQKATWFKNGSTEVKTGGRHEIRVEETKHTLVIQNTKLTDQSEYTVKIADKSTTASVFVTGQ